MTTWGWPKNPALGVGLGILPALLPIAFIGLHIFVAIVQAYIFTILPSVYLGLATSSEPEEKWGVQVCRFSVSPAARCPATTSWRPWGNALAAVQMIKK